MYLCRTSLSRMWFSDISINILKTAMSGPNCIAGKFHKKQAVNLMYRANSLIYDHVALD